MDNHIHISVDLIKQVIIDHIIKTPGISESYKKFFNYNLYPKKIDNLVKVDKVDEFLTISISLSVNDAYYILSVPKKVQENIYKLIKYNFGFESRINISVIDVE